MGQLVHVVGGAQFAIWPVRLGIAGLHYVFMSLLSGGFCCELGTVVDQLNYVLALFAIGRFW